jgi:predicted ATP-grasp superfamily ATP-dependent carboligase
VLGVSEQLVGHRGLGAQGYAWAGNVVPPRLGAAEQQALAVAAQAICTHLAAAFELHGLFGVDLVWDGERAWVVEVNPRPTGSLECVQAAHGVGVFAAHVAACAGRPLSIVSGSTSQAAGKAIVFATQDVRVGDTRDWGARSIRDVPHPGERIAASHPICTLISVQESAHAVLADLEARAATLRDELAQRAGSRARA